MENGEEEDEEENDLVASVVGLNPDFSPLTRKVVDAIVVDVTTGIDLMVLLLARLVDVNGDLVVVDAVVLCTTGAS